MIHKFSLWAFFLLATALSQAQVASHAPTVFRQAPAQKPVAHRQSRTTPAKAGRARERFRPHRCRSAARGIRDLPVRPPAQRSIPKDLAPQIRDGALKMIVFEELVYQEALRRKLTVSAAKLQRAQADFRKQFATPDEFNAFAAERIPRIAAVAPGEDPAFAADRRVSADRSGEQVHRFRGRAQGLLRPESASVSNVPETFTFQTISVLPPANATAAQLKDGRTRAESALQQAKATKSAEEFGLLAEKISDDDYRVMMGQHKPVPVAELPPPVVKTSIRPEARRSQRHHPGRTGLHHRAPAGAQAGGQAEVRGSEGAA